MGFTRGTGSNINNTRKPFQRLEGATLSHSLIRVFIHLVWGTKHHMRTLIGDSRKLVKTHLASYAEQSNLQLLALDVQPEHVHALIRLKHDQRLEDIARLLKGESSHWVNHGKMVPGRFSWQTGYAAFSVDPDAVDVVQRYIASQDPQHSQKTFREELTKAVEETGYSADEIREFFEWENR